MAVSRDVSFDVIYFYRVNFTNLHFDVYKLLEAKSLSHITSCNHHGINDLGKQIGIAIVNETPSTGTSNPVSKDVISTTLEATPLPTPAGGTNLLKSKIVSCPLYQL